MANRKKGALAQGQFVVVDSTDFATIKSAIVAGDFSVKKWYGCNNGVSTATTSGSISKALSLVHSGIFRYTLNTTETVYDDMMLRFEATGCAEQLIPLAFVDVDDSDMLSAITVVQSMASDAASAAQQANSRVLINQSRISDAQSMLSDFYSDFQSRVPKAVATNSQLSDLHSDLRSFLVVMSGITSDILSAVSDLQSDFQSRVPKRVATDSQLSDLASDLRSVLILHTSSISDIQSFLSDFQSDFQSRVPKRVATDSQLSDMASDIKSAVSVGNSRVLLVQSDTSDLLSRTTTVISDLSDLLSRTTQINSRVLLAESMASDAASAAQQANSRVLLNQSRISDIQLFLSDFQSDLYSHIDTTGVGINASSMSDLRSAIAGITITISASDISDIASAVVAGLPVTSTISDIYSMLSDLMSDFQSRVPKRVATDSQLSDLMSDAVSDLKSFIGAGVQLNASSLSDLRSAITVGPSATITVSDLASAVWADPIGARVDSRLRIVQSSASDIYSSLSDFKSDLMSHLDTTGVALNTSTMSDLRSAIAATTFSLDSSSLSDIASAVWARVGSDPTAVPGATDTMGAKADWLAAMSRNKLLQTSTKQSLRNDADGATIASAIVSDDGTTFTRGEFG